MVSLKINDRMMEIDTSTISEKEFANIIKLLLTDRYKEANQIRVDIDSITLLTMASEVSKKYNIIIRPEYNFD